MEKNYSISTINKLKDIFSQQEILRSLRVRRYDPGEEIYYDITGVFPARKNRIKLEIDKFIGGGYAGQVYRVKILEIETQEGPIEGIKKGEMYALKILVPASGFARLFRNFIYGLAFQGPFSLQVNPSAARAGALWQKLIRRGAKIRLGTNQAVVDILATFIDPTLKSCGELSEWVEGRMWRFEVDDNLDGRKKWKIGTADEKLGSPEYRSKKTFMADLVRLLHDMGAHELARQYEWWTCKSQPNALKRTKCDHNPKEGNVAVDFRAGLALLPFLPMCPADFWLILKGIFRGSLVQFDRGNLKQLKSFINAHPENFEDMQDAIDELLENENIYRNSLPDITHHHIKLLFSRKLWNSILKSSLLGWKIRKLIDQNSAKRLEKSRFFTVFFYVLGLIPFLGNVIRKFIGNGDYRRHYRQILLKLGYLRKALKAHLAEKLIRWHRSGRVSAQKAERLVEHPIRAIGHMPLSILPASIHRFFSDKQSFINSLDRIFARPIRLYFKAEAREQWLREMVDQGEKKGMLSDQEADRINTQIKEPFIQKYLKSLAVHVCTVPVTQIVSVLVAIIYVKLHPELSWQDASLRAGIILGLFQITPISPGSLVRGIYVAALVIRERNFKDYNIAFYLSFFKYIGYLAFPIQMAYRYPDLARFMAAHWSTGAVHIVPVFGEHGALLEHAVFDLFYNYPLSLRRRIRIRRERRAELQPRNWHMPVIVLSGLIFLTTLDLVYFKLEGHIPSLGDIWWGIIWIPGIAAAACSAWAGGTSLKKRFLLSIFTGSLLGLFYAIINTVFSIYIFPNVHEIFTSSQVIGHMAATALWNIFLFSLTAAIGTYLTETRKVGPS